MKSNRLGPLILDIDGVALTEDDRAIIGSSAVGGVILFTRNYQSLDQLFQLVKELRSCKRDLLICVDHEGGRVQRFREGFTRLPAMQKLGELPEAEREVTAKEVGWLLASELRAFDIDISFAPVLDVDDSRSTIIGDRSFSADPGAVAEIASALIAGMHDAGMAVTGKHFPGHGGVVADSHLELPIDKRLMMDLKRRDLIPFTHLIEQLDAVMPAHIVFQAIDPEPVGYSQFWLKEYLRGELGFKGVIFSDDLSMEGAVGVGGYTERAEKALGAGCDAILVCNNRDGAIETIEYLESAWNSDEESPLLRMRAKSPPIKYENLRQSSRWKKIVGKLAS